MTLSETICRHQHPAEWAARAPRTHPCGPCVGLAQAIRRQDQINLELARELLDPA